MEYIIKGMWPIGAEPKAYLDSAPIQIKSYHMERIGFFEQPHNRDLIEHHRVEIVVELPEAADSHETIKITAVIRGEEVQWQSIDISKRNIEEKVESKGNSISPIEKKSCVRIFLGKVKRRLKRYANKLAEVTNRRNLQNEPVIIESDYERWCSKAQLTENQKRAQSNICNSDMPAFSIFLTRADIVHDANKILQEQTYKKWDIIDNKSLENVQGDYIVFWNGTDSLSEDALFEMAQAVRSDDEVDIVYGDDELDSADGRQFYNTRFKPDYNLELLRTQNYVGDFFAVKKELVHAVGALNWSYEEWMTYDYLLRCTEIAKRVHHIPRILSFYTLKNKTDTSLLVKCLQDHYKRLGLPVDIALDEVANCCYAKYSWEKKPLISIIIPNKDHVDDLRRCIDSIEQKSTYTNYEFVIVENNSEQPETWAYYDELKKTNPKVKVVIWKEGFNYSALNNFGAKHASGEYYLLLNNDTEIINGDCLDVMLQFCMREDVGAVGARLYYEDDTVQHAGVIIGMGGIAGHAFTHLGRTVAGYMNRVVSIQEYTALTAACLMVKKDAYDVVGGLTENLAVAFNDIDFCLKLREAGYKVIYHPLAELYHYESKSRGAEDTPEKVARFHGEIRYIESRWNDVLMNGDPSYNINLTIDKDAYNIRKC